MTIIKHLITFNDDLRNEVIHAYLITDPKTQLVAGVKSSLSPCLLSEAPELFDSVIAQGLAKCQERYEQLNRPRLVLTAPNAVRQPLISDSGELMIDPEGFEWRAQA